MHLRIRIRLMLNEVVPRVTVNVALVAVVVLGIVPLVVLHLPDAPESQRAGGIGTFDGAYSAGGFCGSCLLRHC